MNTALTRSEDLFEQFCRDRGIPCQRIVASNERSPDYEVQLSDQRVVVEVKEIEPSPQERESAERVARGEIVVQHVTPGERVRRKIASQAGQLRARAQGSLPGMLVLFDDGLVIRHLDSYQIRVAMDGFDTIVFGLPRDPREGVRTLGAKAGKRKKLTRTDNTSISAIAVLWINGDGKPAMTIYHNPHAEVPLEPIGPKQLGIEQFLLARDEPGAIGEWVAV